MQNGNGNQLPLKDDNERMLVSVALARVYKEMLKTNVSDLQARLAIGRAADHLYNPGDKQKVLEQFNQAIGDKAFSRG